MRYEDILAFAAATLLWGGAILAYAQETPAVSPDEKLIEDAAVKFVDAYNAKDAAAIAALFGPKARIEEADGTVIEGSERIQESFAAAFAAEPEAQISLALESLKLLTPDVAVEEGATEFFRDGETLTSRGRYTVVHLKNEGVWRMVSARSLEKEVVTNYEYLRQLAWLAGEWVDGDAESTVESSFKWDEGRNFLLQEFTVKRGNKVVQKGSQRIGWDPQKKQLRGWIFDSQGGFGEASWTQVGGSWVVKSSGIGFDGTIGSATRTLTPQGDRIAVSTSDRMSGSELLPDTKFTMVRRPPMPVETAAK